MCKAASLLSLQLAMKRGQAHTTACSGMPGKGAAQLMFGNRPRLANSKSSLFAPRVEGGDIFDVQRCSPRQRLDTDVHLSRV